MNDTPPLVFDEPSILHGVLSVLQLHANAIPAVTRIEVTRALIEALTESVNKVVPAPQTTRELYAVNKVKALTDYENQFRSNT